LSKMQYCPQCGTSLVGHVVAGEPRNHWFCESCDALRYDHTMVVVSCFIACGQNLLWVQRNLEPKRGLWAIPGGFLENGETLAQGAARELYEEAGVFVPAASLQLYMTGAITFINQVYISFRATVDSEDVKPGIESIDCGFFSRRDCPWEQVAYPEVNDCIVQAYDDLQSGSFAVWQAEMTDSRYVLRAVDEGSRSLKGPGQQA
jgi:ADP-ribose pyrophosphatase YjhB (NUDIX family)